MAVLAAEVGNRKSFEGVHNADLHAVYRMMGSVSQTELVFLRCCMDGTLFTNNARAHWQEGVSDRCPWCGAVDGNYHRAWECPGFADCRASVPDWILRYVPSLPSSFSAHAWPPLPSAWLSYGRTLASLSDGLVKAVGGVIDGAGSCDLFTDDGACLLPHEPPLRLAAWAVAIGRLDWNTLDHHVLAAGPLPGLHQTAFRAELYYVAVALECASTQACEMRIWSDCQAVVDGVRRVQAGLYHFQANGSHADLWLRVSKALKRVTSKVMILKVAAHQTIVADLPPLETWAFWQNELVDAAARKANMQRSDQFWDGWKQLALQLAETRQIYQAVVQVHIRVGKKAVSTSNPPDAGAGGLISAGARRVARRFPNTVQLPLELTVVPKLTHRYRHFPIWRLCMHGGCAGAIHLCVGLRSVEWVPFLYLALDYMLHEPRIRPLAHRRQWADGVDRPLAFPAHYGGALQVLSMYLESLLEVKPGFYLQ